MSAKEDMIILHNILARGGDIGEIDLHVELSKAKSAINGMKAQSDMQNMANTTPVSPVQAPQSMIGSPAVDSATQPPQEPLGVDSTQNGGTFPQEPTQ